MALRTRFWSRRRAHDTAGGAAALPAAWEADRAEIAASGLFDPAWYLRLYPDVAEAGLDPLVHYVTAGAAEDGSRGPAST